MQEPVTAAASTAAAAAAAAATGPPPPPIKPFYEPAFAAVSLPPLDGGLVPWIRALALANPFWLDVLVLLLLGGFLGCVGYAFLKAVSSFTTLWLSADGNAAFPAASTLRFGAGRAWWIALCGGGGMAVGLGKAVLGVDGTPGFVAELRTMECELALGLKTGVLALLSLMGGAPLGPEVRPPAEPSRPSLPACPPACPPVWSSPLSPAAALPAPVCVLQAGLGAVAGSVVVAGVHIEPLAPTLLTRD